MNPLVPVMFNARLRAYPKHGLGGVVAYELLSVAMVKRYHTDAHLACYSLPEIPRRLSKDIILKQPVEMVLAVFDRDCQAVHGTSAPAPESWWQAERVCLFDLLHDHPGAFVYRTRGGYRVVYVLECPVTLSQPEHSAQWKALYVAWCSYIARRYGIEFDRGCKDWQRLYRLPFVTRDGIPEQREVMGDPCAIGAWSCRLLSSDFPQPKRTTVRPSSRPTSYTGRGVLFEAFQARGWIDREHSPGAWIARCPFEERHTTGETFDGSTLLYEAAPGHTLGFLYCLHGHCEGLDVRDVLRAFTDEELKAAAGGTR